MENFKIIEGFETYSVSDHGNVKNNKTGRILKGAFDGRGYKHLNVDGKTNKIHRLVAVAFLENPENKKCVDHIDNNRSNNLLINLRWTTHTENCQNSSLSKRNSSGIKGIYFNKASQKWHAQIKIDGIKIHIGYFTDIEDAKQARITRANEAFGVFTNSCEKII